MPARKNESLSAGINIDSLMDITTCLFGIILFVIIIAVIDARGVNVKMYMPMATRPPASSIRKICICANGTARILDISDALQKLGAGNVAALKSDPAGYVAAASSKNISDRYFRYRLDYAVPPAGTDSLRGVSFTVEELPGVRGDTVENLQRPDSAFAASLNAFDSTKHWIAFAVDKNSVAVFKKARELCLKKGFMTGWDPAAIYFPYREPLFDDARASGDLLPSPDLTKINTG